MGNLFTPRADRSFSGGVSWAVVVLVGVLAIAVGARLRSTDTSANGPSLSASSALPEPDFTDKLEVVSYDAPSNTWGFVKVDAIQRARVQFEAVCESFELGGEKTRAPDVCNISVGDTLIPAHPPEQPEYSVSYSQTGDTLSIVQGSGYTQSVLQFRIKSARLLESGAR